MSFVYDCYLGLIVLATILFGTQQLFGSIINTMHVSWVLSFSLKYLYKNNNKDNANYIKIQKIIQTLQNKMVIPIYIDNR